MDFKKPQPGDPLSIPASTFGAMIDATVAYQKGQANPRPAQKASHRNTGVILVKNTTGDDLDLYACVQIDMPITLPADNQAEFQQRIAFKVVEPDSTKHMWVILQQPLLAGPDGSETDGEMGYAVIAGVTICKINLAAVDDTQVDSDVGGYVPISGGGPAQIVWVAGGVGTADETGEQLAVIAIGAGGGGGDPTAGTEQFQLRTMVTANRAGWQDLEAHP